MAQFHDTLDADNCNGKLVGAEIQEQKLRSQKLSTSSIDSGMCSRGQSSSSLPLYPSADNFSITGHPQPTRDVPIIIIDEIQADRSIALKEHNTDRKISPDIAPTDWQLLDISTRGRKGSNTSTISSIASEYFTAPTSPDPPTLTRSMSLDSITSVASLIPPHYCPAVTNFSRSSQTMITHIERKAKSICVTVELQSSPADIELRFRPQSLKIKPKDQKPQHTSSSTPESFPCDLTVKVSYVPAPFQTNPVPLTTTPISKQKTENERIEQVVRNNLVEFSKNTNLEALYPHLISSFLLSTSDYEQLQAIKSTNGRMNDFYIFLLPKKGKYAYENLFKCLKEENTHCGHEGLVNLINAEL